MLAALVLCLSLIMAYSDWASHQRRSHIARAAMLTAVAQEVKERLAHDTAALQRHLRAFAMMSRLAPEGSNLTSLLDGFDAKIGDLRVERVRVVANNANGMRTLLSWPASDERSEVLLPVESAATSVGVMASMLVPSGTAESRRIVFAIADKGAVVVSAWANLDSWLDSITARHRSRFDIRIGTRPESDASLLYETAPLADKQMQSASVSIGQSEWHIEASLVSTEQWDAPARTRVVTTIAIGSILAMLVGLLGYRRVRAERLAQLAQQQASYGEHRLQRAASVAHDGIWEYDSASGQLYCSDTLLAMLQFVAPEKPGARRLLRMLNRHTRRSFFSALRASFTTTEAIDITCPVALRGGERWLRLRARITTYVGDPHASRPAELGLLLTGSVSDITETVSARVAAENYRSFLDRVLDALPAPVVVKDEHLHIVRANRAFLEASGVSADVAVGARSHNLFGEDVGQQLEALDRAAFASAAVQTAMLWFKDQTGNRRYCRVTKTLCIGADAKPVVVTTFEDLTQLSVQEQQQSRLRAFLQQVFDAVPHPLFVKDQDHRYIMTNRAHAQSLGRTVDEVIGRSSRDLASEELARAIEESERALFEAQGERLVENEYVLRDTDGLPRNTIVRKAACLDADGNRVIVGINTDITALRETERDLRRTLRRFAALIQNAPLAIVLMNEDGKLVEANPSFCAMTGYAAADIPQLTHRQLSPQREHALDDEKTALVYAKGFCEPFEKHYVRRDGSEVPVMITAVLVKVEDEPLQIWALAQDTSERNLALAALRESEARWQFALEGSGDGVWDWHTSTDKAYFSPRWKAMLGYADNEIDCQIEEWRSRIHADDRARVDEAMAAHLSNQSPLFVCEYRMLCKAGHYVWILDRGKTIERDDSGKPVRLIGTLTDITASKDVEEELRRHRDGLKDLVQEQTAHLLRAKEAAEKASEAKSVFLANMSHELRTPMHAILSFARLGESRFDSAAREKMRDYFARILSSGERLMSLLNDLLDLSKLEAGRMNLELNPVHLTDIAYEVAAEYEAWLRAKSLKFIVQASPDLPRALADAPRIGQVMRNLLSNAAKFSPDGGCITLSLRAARLPSGRRADDTGESSAVEFVVADEGPGVPAVELESVFEKFVQSSVTRTGAGGTGLGLAICREIIDAHRGQIFARNRDQGGAEFVVRLPAEGVPQHWIAEE